MIENIDFHIRQATPEDCLAIAELALIAGEGMPAYFWAKEQQAGKSLEEVGAMRAANEQANFSYCNAHMAVLNKQVVGMILGYVLPPVDQAMDISSLPGFV